MILVISDTPVAGTVDRLASWIEKLSGQKTMSLVKRNYPHNAFSLRNGTFGCMPNWEGYIDSMVRKATCIILHNVLDEKVIDIVFLARAMNVSVIYQLHSPPLEGPQFTYEILSKYKFDSIFSVNQGHGRFFKNSTPVPNIVPDFQLYEAPIKQDLVFVPHIRTTDFKWSNKFSLKNSTELNRHKSLYGNTKIVTVNDLFSRKSVSHSEIQFALKFCSFVIDDINTGLMHQTAIEGLKAGCGVFSNADMYTIEEYSNSISAPVPPLIYVDNIADVVKFLVTTKSSDYLDNKGDIIKNYSDKYLGEERLAKLYFETLENYLI
jgi:hypothetical protein